MVSLIKRSILLLFELFYMPINRRTNKQELKIANKNYTIEIHINLSLFVNIKSYYKFPFFKPFLFAKYLEAADKLGLHLLNHQDLFL